jgi:AraC-like DNA-binding protein
VDIIWSSGGSLQVAGPDTRAFTAVLDPGTIFVGVRFLPGAAPELLGEPANLMRNSRTALSDLWGPSADRLLDRLMEQAAPGSVGEMLQNDIIQRASAAKPPDSVVREAILRLRAPGASTAELARSLFISERQLRRKLIAAVGYGPKMLHRVLRLQRLLAIARSRRGRALPLAQIAGYAGFADQAHMTRDCAELAGLTPRTLLNR